VAQTSSTKGPLRSFTNSEEPSPKLFKFADPLCAARDTIC